MMKKYICHSVSLCIADIIRGEFKKENIDHFKSGTAITDESAVKRVLDFYSQTYWADNPELGKEIFLQFWNQGKVIQPRLENKIHLKYVGDIEARWELIS